MFGPFCHILIFQLYQVVCFVLDYLLGLVCVLQNGGEVIVVTTVNNHTTTTTQPRDTRTAAAALCSIS
jgi:ABC-type protease/lipase transport system fused ATPase/permease subunit